MWDLPGPGIDLASLESQGGFLTTGPPGKPQVWYLDLFAGTNDYEAMRRAGTGGHKEINRTNLSAEAVEKALQRDVVQGQLALLKLRSACPVFSEEARISFRTEGCRLEIRWDGGEGCALLSADLGDASFTVTAADAAGRDLNITDRR